MLSFAAIASDNRFNTSTPQPSARAKPFADASNVLHFPSGDRAFNLESKTKFSGTSSRLTPATRALEQLPFFKLSQARSSATSADEHMVLTVNDGPSKPNV